MKENRLTIRIGKPVSEVFDFTITPANTPRWIDSIVEEKTMGEVIGIGTFYANKSKGGDVNLYEVTDFKKDQLFEMRQVTSAYHVRYTYKELSPHESELEYLEWVDIGEIAEPFTQDVLEKLKSELEKI